MPPLLTVIHIAWTCLLIGASLWLLHARDELEKDRVLLTARLRIAVNVTEQLREALGEAEAVISGGQAPPGP